MIAGALRCLLTAVAWLVVAGAAQAIERIELSWGRIESAGVQLHGVELSLDVGSADAPTLRLAVEALVAGDYRFEQLELSCPGVEWTRIEFHCRRGTLSLRGDPVSADGVPASLRYHMLTRRLDIAVSRLGFAGGRLKAALRHAPDGWRLDTGFTRIDLAALAAKAARWLPAVGRLSYQGGIQGSLSARGNADGVSRLDWRIETVQAGYSNAGGEQAGEALELLATGHALAAGADTWKVHAELEAPGGMLYSEPVYLEFAQERALRLAGDFIWRAPGDELVIESLSIDQPQVLQGSLEGRVQPLSGDGLHELRFDIERARVDGLYTTWLQPWLAGSLLGDLETGGYLRGRLEIAAGKLQAVSLDLDGIGLRERGDQFDVQGLDGRLRWHAGAAAQTSTLAWRSASLYRLQFGAADVALLADADSLTMREPLAVPLFDGELRVEAFEIAREGGQIRWLLDGMLTPVSMQALSAALDWPPLSGTLSGMFPNVRYRQGELSLGGVLLVQAFGGDITLHNLLIDQPLGLVPRLWVDARLAHLDLKTLTQTFSFGRIEGQLEGRVDKLYMEAWQPVSFDARFQTPENDNSRRRISQRAVDNISNLGGGGVGGALSRSFLRFLEDFPYRALGIACRLENGVCEMDGVAPARDGYYLVQGRLIPPRLDVIGYAREVDWHTLVDRLKAVTAGGTPKMK